LIAANKPESDSKLQEPLPEWKAGPIVKPLYGESGVGKTGTMTVTLTTPTTPTLTASLRQTSSVFKFLVLHLGEGCVSVILTPREWEQLVELGLEVS
jgi:hypothetical protein